MTVEELMKELAKIPKNLPVCIYADHGQSTMKAFSVKKEKVCAEDFDNFMMDTVHPDDIEDDSNYIEICQIEA